jgi:hypothetical protein
MNNSLIYLKLAKQLTRDRSAEGDTQSRRQRGRAAGGSVGRRLVSLVTAGTPERSGRLHQCNP